MKIYFLTSVLIIFFVSCGSSPIEITKQENDLPIQSKTILENTNSNSVSSNSEETKTEYPGITIDEKFPITENRMFTEDQNDEKIHISGIDDYEIKFDRFTPKTISQNGKTLFKFKTLYNEGYWANLTGIANLLGEKSKQIYITASGTGGVCCTNYWITDVSNGTPRNVFRSEDYGGFRDPMEVFDADGDGVYELMQWDSAFRYFLDDCGACSPEPRAIFKYDKKLGKYLPAKNIQQDFVKKDFLETEKWILESFAKLEKLEKTNDTENQEYLSLLLDYNRRFLDHIIGIFYLGDEEKAWKTFDKYYNSYSEKEKVRAEIKKRLRQSKFFQALKKSA